MMLTLDRFEEACEAVSKVTQETKLIYSDYLSVQTGGKVYLKPENMQFTGAYKLRGAYYKTSTLTDEEKKKGVITASAGNHAQGVAYAAKCGNMKATIVMPTTTPLIKVNRTKNFGADVVLYGDVYDEVIKETEKELGYPVFVKPANLGSSIGVSRADDRESLEDSLELAFEYDRRVLIEAGLDKPIELNCSVLGYDEEIEASPIEMPINQDEFLDFKDKYLASGGSKGMASLHRVLPAPIEDELKDEIQEMSRKIFRMLDCKGVVRIDYMFDPKAGKLYITEINTIPGSMAFYLWENAGVAYTRLIDRMVGYAEKAHGDKNRANYAYTSDILKGVSFGAKGAKGSKGAKTAK